MPNVTFSNNQDLEKAWEFFVEKGTMPRDLLRPEVAQSWYRSRRCIDHNTIEEMLSGHSLEMKIAENTRLIQTAQPVLQDISKGFNDKFWLVLCDKEGYVINSKPSIALGHRCSEMAAGTNAVALALMEGKPMELERYEHLHPRLHGYKTVAAPIYDNNDNLLGILGIGNHDGQLPEDTLQIVYLGAQLIRARINNEQLLRRNSAAIIDGFPDCVLLLDEQGIIVNANHHCLQLLNLSNPQNIIGLPITELIIENDISSNGEVNIAIKSIKFNLKTRNRLIPCNLLNMHKLQTVTGNSQLLLFFSPLENYQQNSNISISRKNKDSPSLFDKLIGETPEFIRVKEQARRVARVSSNVLIEGESGTGKELLAQAIHSESGRDGLFIPINCGAISRELLQSELFGYEDGAFTGAQKGGKAGKFEIADGGTVFFDEIGEMPPDMQVSLLRFLQDRIVTRIGGSDGKKVNVRIIAATNRNLSDEILMGNFREDLYFRLNVVNLKLPPLRERKSDIPLMAQYLADDLAQEFKIRNVAISKDVMKILCDYSWPGNARELHNIIESSLVFTQGNTITLDVLPSYLLNVMNSSTDLNGNLKDYEKRAIIDTLSKHNGNISKTAKDLGISRNTLYKKINELDIAR